MTIAPTLHIQNMVFNYAAQGLRSDAWKLVVREFQVQPGEQVLISAPSGSGKSSLLQVIAGLRDPVEGRVTVQGQVVHQLQGATRDRFRGRHIGMIFQTFNLMQGYSAIENLLAPLHFTGLLNQERAARARMMLTQLDISKVDAPIEELSVGQQQRVAVARALVCDPQLVLADEPTASLDAEAAANAMGLIQSMCKDRLAALVCVSHDPSMRGRYGRCVSLKELAGSEQGVSP